MLTPDLIAATGHSLSVRLAVPGARYWLERPQDWTLSGKGQKRHGRTETVVLALHGLEPGIDYRFTAEGFSPLDLRTKVLSQQVSITDFGADPGLADNAPAIQSAVDAVAPGGSVLVPAGRWISGPVFLKSNLEFHLAEGAVLMGRPRDDTWPILPARSGTSVIGSWEGRPEACHAALITAIDAARLTISGPGVLDGGGAESDWWTWAKGVRNGARRARTVHLINCTDVTLLGPTLQNSPSWTIHPQGCQGLLASAMHIKAPDDSPNTDGLNPESCTNVLIEGVRFSVGDDCIAIKSGKRSGTDNDHLRPTAGVHIAHCLMEAGHGGVVIGSEMSGGVSDVTIRACEMVGTDRGLRLKTRRGRGGFIRGVRMEDVTMDRVKVPFCANAFYFCDADGHDDWVQSRAPAACDETTPLISDISIARVQVSGLGVALGAFLGLPEQVIHSVSLRDIILTSLDPDALAAPPIMADHVPALRHEGICFGFAEVTCDDPGLISATSLITSPTEGAR